MLCLSIYLWKRNEEGVDLLNPTSKVRPLFLMAVFHAFTSTVNSLSKKAVILWDMGVAEKYPVSAEVYDKSELSRIKAKECVVSHLCQHMNNSPRYSVYLNFF